MQDFEIFVSLGLAGLAWICLDALVYVWMRLDALGCILTHSQNVERLPLRALLAGSEAHNVVHVGQGGEGLCVSHFLINIKC